jgi:fructokinase
MLLSPEEVDADYIRSARLFHFGSVSLSRSPAREATLHAAELAKDAGVLVSYDPNWRPTLWEDDREARDQVWRAMAIADVVHCAEEEWEFITGTGDLEAGSREVLEAGPRLVVVTLGDRGCYYHDGRSSGDVPGFEVTVIDALGAGDAFVAAMLSQLIRARRDLRLTDERLREVMTYANAAGALACTGRGVIPALPTAHQVEALLAARGE